VFWGGGRSGGKDFLFFFKKQKKLKRHPSSNLHFLSFYRRQNEFK